MLLCNSVVEGNQYWQFAKEGAMSESKHAQRLPVLLRHYTELDLDECAQNGRTSYRDPKCNRNSTLRTRTILY